MFVRVYVCVCVCSQLSITVLFDGKTISVTKEVC